MCPLLFNGLRVCVSVGERAAASLNTIEGGGGGVTQNLDWIRLEQTNLTQDSQQQQQQGRFLSKLWKKGGDQIMWSKLINY